MKIFRKRPKPIPPEKRKSIPDGLWSKCPQCSQFIFTKMLEENLKVCPKCNFHFTLTAQERIKLLLDEDSFQEFHKQMRSLDPLNFKGPKSYKEKLQADMQKTGLNEAAIIGEGKIGGYRCAFGITDSRFIMGSMGSVVGEKITIIAEFALKERIPLVIVSGSGGGARMYEGMFSLMQMAKTSGALAKLRKERIPYISVLTHPTMAGVMASFAGLGDVIIAEPGALIGFTGQRVIKQTIKEDLPPGFQTSEFVLQHGLIDMVVHRRDLRNVLIKLLYYLQPQPSAFH